MVTMTNYVLVPGAGGSAWYWHRLVPELRRRGHEALAVDLPAADDQAGLPEYAAAVIDAAGGTPDPVLVAQSLAGFTAPQACEKVGARMLILLNAMVPAPGETPGGWFAGTAEDRARAQAEQAAPEGRTVKDEFDIIDAFFHDVPADVTADAMAQGEPVQSSTPMSQRWPLARWPEVPTRFLQGRDDRFFPPQFQRRLVRQRLGIDLDEMPGGHLVALSQPVQLADRLEGYPAIQ
jgi:pimeloyl-ACP methyl ester carboxylesterase